MTPTQMANSSLPCLTYHTRRSQSVGACTCESNWECVHVRCVDLDVQACVHVCVIMRMQVSSGLV